MNELGMKAWLESLPEPDAAQLAGMDDEISEADRATMRADWEWGLLRDADAEDYERMENRG